MIGIILSIILPGLGHIYYKKNLKGIIFIILSLFLITYPITLIWSIIDCIRYNKEIPKEERLSSKQAIIGILIYFVVAPTILTLVFLGISNSTSCLSKNYFHVGSTKGELIKIHDELEYYKSQTGKYPNSYDSFINNRHSRDFMRKDYWGENYRYEIIDSTKFRVISSGKDRIFNTVDDLDIRNK